jgi:hypothetical protein
MEKIIKSATDIMRISFSILGYEVSLMAILVTLAISYFAIYLFFRYLK